ncbi:SDR family NAD(P)-dependent oxidoreductase [Flagellimonas lutimaris]|jgi:NAD(P)-dependent dehydrogenase (short-subunit alcohol dehydrogenase family)|uniref:SDR family NAD(P)-dependent oxidoreductase n=1 Tax=Flagellimonas lutimaris TaxID=475082 RepID=UPI000B66818B|nr:MAG: SDR family oxidoreductase [Muricauda sp. TMED12]|tara:strand:+ start:4101 stop:4847 length:747 start_codon:yes stop_codon:yes gene_type:complete
MKLKDKVCIVTGATSGMGKAIAKGLSSEGASLVLSGRNQERGKALEESLDNAVFISGDITDPSYNKKLVDTALETYGKLDILSLNAGVLGLGNVQELPIDIWQNTINTNLSSIFYLCKYALPFLLKESQGNILINASIAAFKSFPNHPAYCASKAASVALMKQMAVDYAPKIRVNAICPGPVDTPLLWESAKAFENPETAVENAKRTTLLKRLGTPEDITKLVLFLVSDDSSWITGTTVTIDGGIINT